MPTILILESNTPEIVDRVRANEQTTAADNYECALKANVADVQVRVVEPYRKTLSKTDLNGIDGVVFTGSGVAWSTDAPEAAPLRQSGEMVFNANLPTIGSCNGLQLAATLLGGDVGPSPKGLEVGLARDIEITPEGRKHAMMQGREDGYCSPCIHRDEVQRLPDGAILLAANAHCPVQAMAYRANGVDFWGMQYHPELSTTVVADSIQNPDGIFAKADGLSSDLRIAETDADAAARLGGRTRDLAEPVRTTELANWLAYISR